MYPKKLTERVICHPQAAIVETTAGKIRGLVTEGTYIFRGVKYADANRFEEPKSVAPWTGVQNARHFGAVCPEVSTPIAHDAYYVPHCYWPQDENCQYLNIWTQLPDPQRKRPVMVWIHGGGFFAGSSVELFAYDGEELSKFGDVVVVSLNHRLNLLGYLDLSAYSEKYRYSGNLGSMDLVAALRWIRENIAQFGGDPNNVMIMGQSGGGGKVMSLMQMPAADGLYHKASIQSGIKREPALISQKDAQAFAEKLVGELGLTRQTISQIETIPYYKLARAAVKVAGGFRLPLGPVADMNYFMGDPRSTGVFREETLAIPLLIGTVIGEFSNNACFALHGGYKNEWDRDTVSDLYQRKFGPNAQAVAEAFASAYPSKRPVDALFVESDFRTGSLDYAAARATCPSAPIYNWLFALECPFNGGTLPWHNAEEAYMFHNAQYLEASYIPGISEALQDLMTGAWVSFAYTGNPNHRQLPHWPSIQEQAGASMIFDRDVYAVQNHDATLLELLSHVDATWGRIPYAQAKLGGGPRQSV